ncbi:hypothetical protein GALMADRAFT_252135 [Galerina marginata CBS 339.88]|uniref:Uncharacterized protein n=1 Tax=Galerina marginata (strain CBS 339.88) TaxID=685588 RepID=A0A067SPL2_GALM3|nr:hypothetical protein GALMADRAFT_252135 [Galerina marginata CBS 339.88]
MVHRPADSRLLTNLLQHEKEYSKQLSQVLDASNSSLASFAAYAAASPPPASNVILAVAGSLAAADEALRRYSLGVDQWRETMRLLKETEDEVGNIMRDREILVTRLIKASKSQKSGSGNFRDSLLLGHQRFPSSSSLSLSIAQQESPSPSPSRPLSASFSSSTKLAAAQSELQACETHLAAKERELAIKRCAAVRDGLGARIKALVDCGWMWGELGKEALKSLEELNVENLEQQAHRPPLVHEPHVNSLLNNNSAMPVAELDSTRPSSDLSSIGPSQSASQVNLYGEEPPPPPSLGTIMNSGVFGEPTPKNGDHPVNNNNASEAVQAQPSLSGTRPPSGVSTTTGSSIYYTPVTPATYKVETMTYAPAVAVHVPRRDASTSAISGPSASTIGSPHGLVTGELFRDDNLHTTVRLPAPHALDGYAYDIPTAGPVAGPSGSQQQQQQYQHRSSKSNLHATPSTSGYSTPQRASIIAATATGESTTSQPHLVSVTAPQPVSSYPQRHVLERRITEEELRKASSSDGHGRHERVGPEEDEDAGSSTEDELKVEKKLVKEGKLALVENPRFMTEARKKELEREKEESEKRRKEEEVKVRKEKGKGKEKEKESKPVDEVVKEKKEKDKKPFSFLHSHRPAQPQQPGTSAITGTHAHVGFADAEERHPPSKSTNSSPSKSFLGSLRGFFGGKQSSPSRSRSSSKDVTAGEEVDLDSDDDTSTTARPGLQGIFRSPSSAGGKKDKGKTSRRWETRTDKNIQLLARRGSFDTADVGRANPASGVGIVGMAAANAGVVTPTGVGHHPNGGTKAQRGRAASDVGVGPSRPSLTTASPGGRRLKKTRAGPPVSASAALAAGGRDDTGSMASSASSSAVELSRPSARAPARAASTAAGKSTQGKVPGRRSTSVDAEVGKRKSWLEGDEEEGMIVDLGRRRRVASEVGTTNGAAGITKMPKPVAPPVPTRSAVAATPSKQTQAKMKTPDATTSKGYSSDTDAMTLVASAPTVTKKKSLTKKRAQAYVAAAPSAANIVVTSTPSIPAHPTSHPPSASKTSTSIPTAPPPSQTPSQKTSSKTLTATPTATTKSPSLHHGTPSSISVATVLPAGGDSPSGTLISQAGWAAHTQALNGGLSRNSSVVSSASAPTGGTAGARTKKPTTLGQGVVGSGGLGRRSTLGGSTPVPARTDTAVAPPVPSGTGGSGSVVQPGPAVPSLMSIVEDVARNREEWTQDMKVRKSVGGTQKPVGMMELVRAPPPINRESLAAFDPNQMKPRATTTTRTSTNTSPKTRMFEVKAPGSVFDAHPPPVAVPRLGQASSFVQDQDEVWATGTVPSTTKPAVTIGQLATKPALRSALRTSRSPSPVPREVSQPPHGHLPTLNQHAPSPVDGTLPWGADGTLQQSSKDKGKGKAVAPPLAEDQNETSDGDASVSTYETGNEFYSDQEDEQQAVASSIPSTSKTKPLVNGVANGHAVGYARVNDSSELSQSTTSTLIVPQSGQLALTETPPPVASSSTSTPQVARRRKSVRVSLQPTFSPSPPAIEYDYEEEQARHAPWSWQSDRQDERFGQTAPIAAPIPVRPHAAREKTVVDVDKVRDMWMDSDDEEDVQYAKAKRLLTRAAKKEKDVNLMLANRV